MSHCPPARLSCLAGARGGGKLVSMVRTTCPRRRVPAFLVWLKGVLMRADAGYWVAFSRVSGIGAMRLRRLWEFFGDLSEAWSAGERALRQAGLDTRTVEAVCLSVRR